MLDKRGVRASELGNVVVIPKKMGLGGSHTFPLHCNHVPQLVCGIKNKAHHSYQLQRELETSNIIVLF